MSKKGSWFTNKIDKYFSINTIKRDAVFLTIDIGIIINIIIFFFILVYTTNTNKLVFQKLVCFNNSISLRIFDGNILHNMVKKEKEILLEGDCKTRT